ncbi:MAG: SGNH/GDSL hydrolase family protein [Candidatus Absconditabacterales bacterium]
MDVILGVRGDSITMGARDLEKGGRVARLHNYLGQKFLREDVDYGIVYNLGIDGDTSSGVLKRFDGEAEARQPDVVIFAIGSNDCTIIDKKETTISLDMFQKNIALLIEKAKKITEKIVFIGTIICDETKSNPIVWAPELSQDMKNTIAYNDVIKTFCKQNNILFIDVIDVLTNKDLEDGIHPTAEGHEKIYIRVRDILLEKKII